MSWWDVGGNGDDVIGDQPADIMGVALARFAAMREAQGQPKPTLQEVVDAVAALAEQTWGSPPAAAPYRIVVVREPGPDVRSDVAAQTSDDPLMATLRHAFEEIGAAYQLRWERAPRLREILETLFMVLVAYPEAYLSDAEGQRIMRFVTESP